MSGLNTDLGSARKRDNIRTGIVLALLAASCFFAFMAKFYILR